LEKPLRRCFSGEASENPDDARLSLAGVSAFSFLPSSSLPLKDPPLNDFPCEIELPGPLPERPAQSMVPPVSLIQDIAAR
jgi:hypothetical protein